MDASGAAVELAKAKIDTTTTATAVVGRKGRKANKSAGEERKDTKQEKSGVKVEENEGEKVVDGDSLIRKNEASTPPPAKKKVKRPSSSSKSKAQSKVTEASSTDADSTNKNDDRQVGSRFWLLKAEPETRIEKGKDVKFSIDDLAACKEPAAWDGG